MISSAVSERIFEKSMPISASDGNRNASAIEDLNVIMRGKSDTIFPKLVHDHLNDFINVPERFSLSRPLCDRAKSAQHRTIGVVAALIWLDNDFERIGLHRNSSVAKTA